MNIPMENLVVADTVRGTLTFDFADFQSKTEKNLDVPTMVSALTRKGKDKKSQMKSIYVNLGMEVYDSAFIKSALLYFFKLFCLFNILTACILYLYSSS